MLAASSPPDSEAPDGEVVARDGIITIVRDELSDDNINQFVLVVDNAYKSSFVGHYYGFTSMNGYLVERLCIRQMYYSMKEIFPFIHSVVSLIVSNPQGEQISIFSENGIAGASGDNVVPKSDEELSKKEQGVLEFFIALIQLQSQKKMVYWAMVPPLAAHSRGHMKNTPSHPLHGVGCDMITMWLRLNQLYDQCTPSREDILRNQGTVSIVFDNWQMMIQKKWQTAGLLSNYLKGVAVLAKRDKAILLPCGLLIRSLSRELFKVRSARYVNKYLTMISADIMRRNDRDHDNEQQDRDDVVEHAEGESGFVEHAEGESGEVDGGVVDVVPQLFTWPQIGWTVCLVKGVPPTAVLDYVNPVVPPPMNACCLLNITSDELLFTCHDLRQSGDDQSCCISSDEYNELIIDAEDVILLDSFRSLMKILHEWKGQLDLEREEDGDFVDDDLQPAYIPLGLPHDYACEERLVSLLDSCEKEIYHAKTFRLDVVCHLYPHAKVPDQYIHFPLIPRDESTNEGMTLMNAAILNSVGLLKKEEHGKYSLGNRAEQRLVFMYGDALTVRLHGAIYDRTLRQITQLGNRNYIEVLLKAHDRVVIQKGQFHQLMHQLGAIYLQFYGGFIQAMQVANGVKRINGDLVKGGYQTHDLFAVRLYRAANRLMLRAICSGGGFSKIVTDDDSKKQLRSVIDRYRTIRKSWEESQHAPSQMVALFMKSMRSYMRCK